MAGLFAEIDGTLSDRAKAQLKCEIIMLTHNEALHETNLAGTRRARTCSGARISRRRNGARAA